LISGIQFDSILDLKENLMLDKLKQMMEVKRQADQLKKELDVSFIDVNEIEGIKLNISGSQKLVSVEIDKNLLTESNKEKL